MLYRLSYTRLLHRLSYSVFGKSQIEDGEFFVFFGVAVENDGLGGFGEWLYGVLYQEVGFAVGYYQEAGWYGEEVVANKVVSFLLLYWVEGGKGGELDEYEFCIQ